MNLVLSQVEESIHVVEVSDDGEALPTRVSLVRPSFFRGADARGLYVHDLNVMMLTLIRVGGQTESRDAVRPRRWSDIGRFPFIR